VTSSYLVVAALAGFLIRQPITVWIKARSGRGNPRDVPAARLWIAVYAAVALVHVVGLVLRGHAYLLYLAIPGAVVFAWHLALIARRAERRQVLLEVVAAAVLALAAPAAYWVGVGRADPLGWWLLGLVWAQSAASILYAYLRLSQRANRGTPSLATRLRRGERPLAFAVLNLSFVSALSLARVLPPGLFVPYLLQAAETVYGTVVPAAGWMPRRIGMRQLLVSVLFTVAFAVTWHL
jgi:hypothetical protein